MRQMNTNSSKGGLIGLHHEDLAIKTDANYPYPQSCPHTYVYTCSSTTSAFTVSVWAFQHGTSPGHTPREFSMTLQLFQRYTLLNRTTMLQSPIIAGTCRIAGSFIIALANILTIACVYAYQSIVVGITILTTISITVTVAAITYAFFTTTIANHYHHIIHITINATSNMVTIFILGPPLKTLTSPINPNGM